MGKPPQRGGLGNEPVTSLSILVIKELGRRSSETTDGGKTFQGPRSGAICLTTKRRPMDSFLGDYLEPMNLNLGK